MIGSLEEEKLCPLEAFQLLKMINNKKARKVKLDKKEHKALVLWAADCAEHVLPYFEKEYPKDDRPRKAIEVARSWAHADIPMVMKEIRAASLNSHAAARQTNNAAARAAARACGQAIATVHVPDHAFAAAAYALKAVEAAGPVQPGPRLQLRLQKKSANVAKEREWQHKHLSKHLHSKLSI